MEIKIEKITKETKVINVEFPLYFKDKAVYSQDSNDYYDECMSKWGVVYLTEDEDGDDVLRVTQFVQRHRECSDDDAEKKYEISSCQLIFQSDKNQIEYWVQNKCTHEEFTQESSRIFKSITNQ